jgi:hypothetical protein
LLTAGGLLVQPLLGRFDETGALLLGCLAVVAIVGAGFLVRWVIRRRKRQARARQTEFNNAFIGATPFTLQDSNRFFGRREDVQRLERGLLRPECRFFAITGASGSGKTSLIQAGLMPRLKAAGVSATHFRAFGSAAARIASAIEDLAQREGLAGEPVTDVEMAMDLLRALGRQSGRPAILILDHFEEAFIQRASEADEAWFEQFVTRLAEAPEPVATLAVCLRADYFAYLLDLPIIGARILDRSSRYHLAPLTQVVAEEVIRGQLAEQPVDTPRAWDDGLVRRIVEDLLEPAEGTLDPDAPQVVLPAELQIVCQMVQRRNIARPSQYPGKATLLYEYLEDSLATSSRPDDARRVIRSLVNAETETRAASRSAAEIAEGLLSCSEAVVVEILRHLEAARLITSRLVEGSMSFELTHDYLAASIMGLAVDPSDRSVRANQCLLESRRRAAFLPDARIRFLDCLAIGRHATEPLTVEDRSLLARSWRRFNLRGCIAVLVLALIWAIPHASMHMDYEYGPSGTPTLVVRKGLPWMWPLLGSGEVLIDTGRARLQVAYFGWPWIESRQPYLDLWPTMDHYVDYFLSHWILQQEIMGVDQDDELWRAETLAEADPETTLELVLRMLDSEYQGVFDDDLRPESLFELVEHLGGYETVEACLLEHLSSDEVSEEVLAWALEREWFHELVLPHAVEHLAQYPGAASIVVALSRSGIADDVVEAAWPRLFGSFRILGWRAVRDVAGELQKGDGYGKAQLEFLEKGLGSVSGYSRFVEIEEFMPPVFEAVLGSGAGREHIRDFLLQLLDGAEGEDYGAFDQALAAGATRALIRLAETDEDTRGALRLRLSLEGTTRFAAACALVHLGEQSEETLEVLLEWAESNPDELTVPLLRFLDEVVTDRDRIRDLELSLLNNEMGLSGESARLLLETAGGKTLLLEQVRENLGGITRMFMWEVVRGGADVFSVLERSGEPVEPLLAPLLDSPELLQSAVMLAQGLDDCPESIASAFVAQLVSGESTDVWLLTVLAGLDCEFPELTQLALSELALATKDFPIWLMLLPRHAVTPAVRAQMEEAIRASSTDGESNRMRSQYARLLLAPVEGEEFEDASRRLVGELFSERALRVAGYRAAVQNALEMLVMVGPAGRRDDSRARRLAALLRESLRGSLVARMAAMEVVVRITPPEPAQADAWEGGLDHLAAGPWPAGI